MPSINPVNRNHYCSYARTEISQQKSPTIQIVDKITFKDSETKREIKGFELVAKSALALTLGFASFSLFFIGKALVRGFAFLAQKGGAFMRKHLPFGSALEHVFRWFLGIPAFIGGLLSLTAALVFSKTQQIAWGKALVMHPQEEKVNTKLARFGGTKQPFEDFKTVLKAFFVPSKEFKSIPDRI